MPFYEYQCTACEHRLEALQKISDEPLRYCPECGEASLKKLISRAAFRLKGGGWYETDFKHSGTKKEDQGVKSENHRRGRPFKRRQIDRRQGQKNRCREKIVFLRRVDEKKRLRQVPEKTRTET